MNLKSHLGKLKGSVSPYFSFVVLGRENSKFDFDWKFWRHHFPHSHNCINSHNVQNKFEKKYSCYSMIMTYMYLTVKNLKLQ
jgi:hypothetical protein